MHVWEIHPNIGEVRGDSVTTDFAALLLKSSAKSDTYFWSEVCEYMLPKEKCSIIRLQSGDLCMYIFIYVLHKKRRA